MCVSLAPTPPFHPSRSSPSIRLSSPCCATALCHLSVLPMGVHICQCYSLFLKGAMEATYQCVISTALSQLHLHFLKERVKLRVRHFGMEQYLISQLCFHLNLFLQCLLWDVLEGFFVCLFVLVKVLLKYNSHTIFFVHLKYTIQLLLIKKCNYHYSQFQNIFITPKEALYTQLLFFFFFSSFPSTLNQPQSCFLPLQFFLFCSFMQIELYNPYFFGLASFTQHKVFKVYSRFSMYRYFIPFPGQIKFYYMNTLHFVYPFIS